MKKVYLFFIPAILIILAVGTWYYDNYKLHHKLLYPINAKLLNELANVERSKVNYTIIDSFYHYLNEKKWFYAYQLVSPERFGTYDFFSSPKGFGNIKSIKLDSLIQGSRGIDYDYYIVQISQIYNDNSIDTFIIFLSINTSHDSIFFISDFRLIPRKINKKVDISNYLIKKIFNCKDFYITKYGSEECKTLFPPQYTILSQNFFYLYYLDTTYYAVEYFMSKKENSYTNNFIMYLIYKDMGTYWLLCNINISSGNIGYAEGIDVIRTTVDDFLLIISSFISGDRIEDYSLSAPCGPPIISWFNIEKFDTSYAYYTNMDYFYRNDSLIFVFKQKNKSNGQTTYSKAFVYWDRKNQNFVFLTPNKTDLTILKK